MHDSSFLDVLFDPEDFICLGRTKYDIDVIRKDKAILDDNIQWVSINSFSPYSSRSIKNVNKLRSILIEIDTRHTGLDKYNQHSYIKNLNMPFSTAVYSGGESLHYIISLTEPLIDMTQYKHYSEWLYNIVDKADKACRNPQCFTRMAESIRLGVNKKQELLYNYGRVDNKDFERWLTKFSHLEPKIEPIVKKPPNPSKSIKFRRSTREFLQRGEITPENLSRHQMIKNVTIDFILKGQPQEKAESMICEAVEMFHKDKDIQDVVRLIDWVYNNSNIAKAVNDIYVQHKEH